MKVCVPTSARVTVRITSGLFAAALAVIAAMAMPSVARAQQVIMLVNGAPITNYDIEQRSKLIQLSAHKAPPRQEVLEELINDKIKIQEAKRYGIEIPEDDVDRAVANMGAQTRMNLAQFTQALASSGVNIATLKARVRAEIAWGQLVRGRFSSSLQIDDKDIREVLETKKPEGATVGYDYIVRPVVFIVPKGSPSSVVETRLREAEGLRTRFQGCDEGVSFIRGLRDVAVRDQVVRTSADLAPALRDVLDNTPVGRLTKPEVTPQGIELFALCEKKETKADTPQRRGARQQLFSSKFDEQSNRYLKELRRAAMIENK
jgi:peptidyl-prolyl cis-trans isomerase SurA